MQGVSFGLANLPYRLGQTHELTSRRHQHRDDASPVSATTNTLSRLSNSVRGLRDQLDALSTSAGLPDGLTAGGSVSGSGAQLINKQRGVLQIHTQEGDVVTLRFKSKVSVAFDNQQLSADGVAVNDTNAEVRSYSRVALSVEGDLNADELKAIEDLVGKVGDLTNEFFYGDMNNVLSKAMSLSYDSSLLADFSLDLRLKQSISAYTYALPLPPVVVPDISSGTSSSVPESAPSEAATQTSEPVVSTVAAEPLSPPVTETPTDAPTDISAATTTPAAAAAAAEPSTASSTSAMQIVADYVAKVRASFSTTAGDASLGFSYEFKVRLLMSSITQSAPVAGAPSAGSLSSLEQQLTAGAV